MTAYTFDADATDADIPTPDDDLLAGEWSHGSDDQQHQRRVQLDADRGPGPEHLRVHRPGERRRG